MIVDRYVNNTDLPTIHPDWKGTPISAKGRYINHEYPFIPEIKRIIEWKSKPNPDARAKKSDNWRLQSHTIDDIQDLPADSVTWLGHATFLIKMGGYTIITDPIYRSPTVIMPRYVDLPISPAALVDIDLVLVSHDHRDHTDASSLQQLLRNNNRAEIYTGLGMSKLLSGMAQGQRIIEAGWYQQYPHPDLTITYLPMRHWGKRSLTDTNRRLWGGFHINAGGKSIIFGADSGYGSHYQEIRQVLGPIDVAIIGIGAYKPEWFMHPSHTSPSDGYRAACDLEAKTMIPMHYGTFDLSDEPIGEPYRQITAIETPAHLTQIKAISPGIPFRL